MISRSVVPGRRCYDDFEPRQRWLSDPVTTVDRQLGRTNDQDYQQYDTIELAASDLLHQSLAELT